MGPLEAGWNREGIKGHRLHAGPEERTEGATSPRHSAGTPNEHPGVFSLPSDRRSNRDQGGVSGPGLALAWVMASRSVPALPSSSRLVTWYAAGTSRSSSASRRGRRRTGEDFGRANSERSHARLITRISSEEVGVPSGLSLRPSLLQPRMTEKRHQLFFLRIPRPMPSESVQPVTELLRAAQAGDAAAAE